MRKEDEFDRRANALVFCNREFRTALEEMKDAELAELIASWAREHWGPAKES